jgi:hypothetical protein
MSITKLKCGQGHSLEIDTDSEGCIGGIGPCYVSACTSIYAWKLPKSRRVRSEENKVLTNLAD